MHILYITYDGVLDPVSQSQVLPYLEGLSKNGIFFTLLSFEKKERLCENKVKESCYDKLKKCRIDWMPVIYHKRPAVPATIFDVLKGVAKGLRLLKSNRIDAVHARGYIPMLIAYILKKIAGAKVIFDMRGFWAEEKVDARAWKKGGVIYRIVKRMESAFLSNADEIVVLTSAAKKYILGKKYPKVHVSAIPCCADLNIFKRLRDERAGHDRNISGNPVVLYAGSLGTFYSLDKVLDFFLSLKTRNPSAFLRVISHYPKESMEAACFSRNIKKTWYRLEALDHKDMPKAFSEADLSVIFYNRPLSGIGCSPIKLAESLACGIPVVINAGIGDCDDIVEHNNVGVVIKDFSQEEYKRASHKMLELVSQKESTALRCAEVAKKMFSLDAGIAAYQNIYERLAR